MGNLFQISSSMRFFTFAAIVASASAIKLQRPEEQVFAQTQADAQFLNMLTGLAGSLIPGGDAIMGAVGGAANAAGAAAAPAQAHAAAPAAAAVAPAAAAAPIAAAAPATT